MVNIANILLIDFELMKAFQINPEKRGVSSEPIDIIVGDNKLLMIHDNEQYEIFGTHYPNLNKDTWLAYEQYIQEKMECIVLNADVAE